MLLLLKTMKNMIMKMQEVVMKQRLNFWVTQSSDQNE